MPPSTALAGTPRILVLGGGFAGVLVARRLGSALRGDASIRLVNDRDTFVERVRLHQVATGQDVVRPRIAQMIGNHAATFTRGRVTSINVDERTVWIRRDDEEEETAGYDFLVYALGSTIDLDSVPGVRACCASVADEAAALDMMQRLTVLQKNGDANVLVCGGGLTGIELAAEIGETFPSLRVSLVTAGRFGEAFSPAGTMHIKRAFERLRIDVREQTSVVSVRRSELVLEEAPLPFDLCVWAASFAVPDLAQKAGLQVDRKNRIVVDAHLRSVSNEHIFAAGDCAIPLPSVCVPIRMGCATAMPMAGLVSDNIANAVRGRALETFRYAYLAQFVSLGRRDALAQFVHADDSPRAFTLDGRFAAWMKELTFRMNMFSLGTGFYPWRLAMLGAPIA